VTTDDNAPMGSIRAAVPFSNKIQVKSEEQIENMEYSVNAYVEQLSAAMIGSNEMEIKGSVALDSICFAPCETESVMECEVEDYEENEFLKFPSIIGYIANGEETLWDIAKRYHTTVDSVKNRNRQLSERGTERIKRGDKLLLVKAAR
ncbi:MAG: LysM peptidoglycan-binding domain-containing protein, partial [Lachnospira sp.]|nr:LysM peptidoglycan-binding domain-containing protein [Lachnospira sp.]